MFLMSNSTKICNVFNKYKSKIVQLNFKIKVVSLPGNKDKFPPESLIICREILNPIPLPPSLVVKKGINMCSECHWEWQVRCWKFLSVWLPLRCSRHVC